MNLLIDNTKLDVDFSNLVNELINEYREISTEYENTVRFINQQYKERLSENRYLPEYLNQLHDSALSEALEDFSEKRKPLNKKLNQGISELKKQLLHSLNKPVKETDYAVRVSNAIKFIELEGKGITDKALHSIVGEFSNDMELMKRFRRMVEIQTGDDIQLTDVYGNTKYPLSFGDLARYEMFETELETLESMAQNLFISQMSEQEVDNAPDGKRLSVPMDCLGEQMTEHTIKETALNCEEMAAEMFPTSD